MQQTGTQTQPKLKIIKASEIEPKASVSQELHCQHPQGRRGGVSSVGEYRFVQNKAGVKARNPTKPRKNAKKSSVHTDLYSGTV